MIWVDGYSDSKAVTGAKIIALDLDNNNLKVAKENGAKSVVN